MENKEKKQEKSDINVPNGRGRVQRDWTYSGNAQLARVRHKKSRTVLILKQAHTVQANRQEPNGTHRQASKRMATKGSATETTAGDSITINGPGWRALMERHIREGETKRDPYKLAGRLRMCRLNARRDAGDRSVEASMLRYHCEDAWNDLDRGTFGNSAVSTADSLCHWYAKGDHSTCTTEIAGAILAGGGKDDQLRSLRSEWDDVLAGARKCGLSTSGKDWQEGRARLVTSRAHVLVNRRTNAPEFGDMVRANSTYTGQVSLYRAAKAAGADDMGALCMASVLLQDGPISP